MSKQSGKIFKCDYCGKEFYVPLWLQKQNNKIGLFCSHKCYGKWRSENLIGFSNPLFRGDKIKCLFCGKEIIRRASRINEGQKFCSYKCYHQWMVGRKGKETSNWQGGITPENVKIRHNVEYRLWREAVFARDNWTCQKCGKRGDMLHAHHIENFADFPELRFAIDNGITLCANCHREIHFNKQI